MTHPYLDTPGPIILAHRGGAREAPENSLTAFQRAIDLGVTYIETDIRCTADGIPVVFHDAALQRVTDRVGRIRDLPFSEVRKARIGGMDPVQSLDAVLRRFPTINFNLDIKEDNAVGPTLEVLAQRQALHRVCVASFNWSRLRAVRAHLGEAGCTALAPQEVAALAAKARFGRMSAGTRFVLPEGHIAVQVPPSRGAFPLITSRFLREAHRRGWPVHAWTINDRDSMLRLINLGVDGIVTDRPSILAKVLNVKGSSDTDETGTISPPPLS